VLTITPGAGEALAHLRDTAGDLPEGGGVRIARATDEDGEPAFTLDLVEAAAPDDVVFEGHALPVFVDPDAAPLLEGTALDGETHGDHVHFGFVRPNDANEDPVVEAE